MKYILLLVALLFSGYAIARESYPGEHAKSPLHDWYTSLKNKNNLSCCGEGDCTRMADVNWGIENGHYWVDMPWGKVVIEDEKVVDNKGNPTGGAVVCYSAPDNTVGNPTIFCFVPGALF